MNSARATSATAAALIDVNHPVISQLGRLFGGKTVNRRIVQKPIQHVKNTPRDPFLGSTSRTDIVSEQLCDDTLKYLAPTLEPYKGCTIIDIHPGACIWSQKLHDFLKPSTHLLMEPDWRYTDTFVQPLLNAPGSRYRHTPLSGAHPKSYYRNYQTIYEQGLLPRRKHLDLTDAANRRLDTSLLVTGNLARQYGVAQNGYRLHQFPEYILAQMAWAALANDMFHEHGLVRMLWWVPEKNKPNILTQKFGQRNPMNVGMQLGTTISEVVGVRPISDYLATQPKGTRMLVERNERYPVLKAYEVERVRARMEEGGFRVPKGREILRHVQQEGSEGNPELVNPLRIHYQTLQEIEAALDACKSRLRRVVSFSENTRAAKRLKMTDKKEMDSLSSTTIYPQCLATVRGHPMYQIPEPKLVGRKNKPRLGSRPLEYTAEVRLSFVLDLQFRIVNLEANCSALQERGLPTSSVKSDILALSREFRSFITNYSYRQMTALGLLSREHLALFSPGSVFSIDERGYEPLQASAEDFWPKHEMTLLDMVPKPRDMAVPDIADRREVARTAQRLIKQIFIYNQPLTQVLDRIAPNAAQDLIPMCPAITDARRGGRLDPEALYVKMVTDEMIEQLVKAWFEWPFRPSNEELALASGSLLAADDASDEAADASAGESPVQAEA